MRQMGIFKELESRRWVHQEGATDQEWKQELPAPEAGVAVH